MDANNYVRNCPECGTPVTGRSDKKFCSDNCRSTHFNRLHRSTIHSIRSVNYALRRNRRILEALNPGGKRKVPASQLREYGFDFRFHTSTLTKDGVIYYYCYEQGYGAIGKDQFLLVAKEDF